ncbi:intracellular hyaluronan-binding protein 4-like isoform X1 [Megalops cyprinoides]|uniref:intracellular hyaluronan-binding protein 4-like isoform X1 n=1 Tax=Megalops cyprinoides TaxID=118141 RepID=UPI0018646CAB|nr:intracellular hyaluronan-binding protein 4-like isoform X1 [Megalops cyprinoides]
MQQDTFGCSVMNRFDQLLDDEADPFDILREVELEKQKKKKKEELKKAKEGKHGKRESQKDRKLPQFVDGGVGQIRNSTGVSLAAATCRMRTGGRWRLRETRDVWFFASEGPTRWKPLMKLPWRYHLLRGGTRAAGVAVGAEESGMDTPGMWTALTRGPRGNLTVRMNRNWRPGQMRCVGMPQRARKWWRWTARPGCDRASEEADGEEVEKVAVEMSLDEWRALQEQSRPKQELNLRKADTRVPSKAVVIHKSKHLQAEREALIEEDEEAHFFRRPANDITTKLVFNFGNLPRPSRGGRGGRGGRGRGGAVGRTERAPAQTEVVQVLAPNPDDLEDFPALA